MSLKLPITQEQLDALLLIDTKQRERIAALEEIIENQKEAIALLQYQELLRNRLTALTAQN